MGPTVRADQLSTQLLCQLLHFAMILPIGTLSYQELKFSDNREAPMFGITKINKYTMYHDPAHVGVQT